MKDSSVSSNGFPGSFVGAAPVVTKSTSPLATETVPGSSPRQRLLAALTGLLPRNLPFFPALSVTALLAVLAVGLLLLLPGGPAWAQSAGTTEYPENGTGAVATYTAMDPEQTAITSWTLAGTDAAAFTIEGGVLRFAKSPDYETPTDVVGTDDPTAAAGDNSYEITVRAMDSTGKTGEKAVMVDVIDVDEPGTVTLSALRPQVKVVFTASLTDLDGDVTNPKWQWAKSSSKNGSYTDIEGAEDENYTPIDAVGKSDINDYLRATASYTDGEGSGKTAVMNSEYTVQAARVSNTAPEFADDQDPVMDAVQAAAAREVAENTAPGTDIGAPVAATDADDDVLTYTLEGDNAASFDIDPATGQLMTKAALDEEEEDMYTVTVRATDPAGVPQADSADSANSDTVVVVIAVTDVNEPPAVDGAAPATFNEKTGEIDTALAAYTANDPETASDNNNTEVTWSVAGPDGGKFTATGGELKFKAKPDYENATDANTDNVYEVTVQATDGDGNRGMKSVKVTVENADEDGVVTLSKTQPRVGIAVTASLTDPDKSISGLTWQWTNSDGEIKDANSDTYTPVGQREGDANGDIGDTLTAKASYTDGYESERMAEAGSVNIVAVDTRNRPPAFADQDPDTDGMQNDTATRKVEENTEAVATDDVTDADDVTTDNVGGVVMATDPDPNAEDLTYTLGGADAAKFRVRANGQIEVGSGTMLDYETKQTYMVTVMAEDSFGASSSIDVTIEVNPIDEAPDVSGAEATEYPENGTGAVATYTAMDPEQTAITSWTLAGTDAAAFTIEGGVLRFAKSPDYETPTDVVGTDDPTAAAGDNSYEITVRAMDSTGKTGEKAVMVDVIDVDEPGTVTLSALRPQVKVVFTASLTDLDGDVTNPKWQWAKSSSKNGSYTDIEGAEDENYTPIDAVGKSDINDYLRATASYTDGEGSGKTAVMNSEYTVQAARVSNTAPEFADDQDPVMDAVQAAAAREVAENTAPGTDIGAPVAATDADDDVLTYTLEGDNAASFDIDPATGQLMTKAALDEEEEDMYTVTVRATDPAGVPQADSADSANSDTVVVVIAVTDVNEPPAVDGAAPATFNEKTGEIDTALAAYTANDPETASDNNNTEVTWSVAGPDGGKFTATGGELKFKAKPDYENATDANTDNVYEVTVQATDGDGNRGMKSVKVTVENADEDGVVTLSKTQPRVGIAVTASLTDPDKSISGLTWQWTNSDGEIKDANSDTYTPVGQREGDANGDIGDTLTAKASYTDGYESERMAEAGSVNIVAVDTRNRPPAFADQDPDTDGMQNDTATRKVEENTEAVATDDVTDADDVTTDNVGGVVMATDPDPNAEDLTYTLGGADAAKFRVRANGQIEVGSGTMLDYETKQTYMVTVMAEDSFGASSSIDVTIEVNPIDEAPTIMRVPDANVAPEFASATTSRTVAENTAAGEDIGNPVAANDANGDTLAYTLGGADAASFDIDGTTGQLRTKASLDFETKSGYTVMVTATDPRNLTATATVTITVTNVDEGFEVSGPAAVGYAEDRTDPVATYSATDPESATIAWTLEGDDAADFDISTGGVLTFRSLPDYEAAADDDTDNVYKVTVKASDGTNEDPLDVIITVTDVDEDVAPADPLKDKYDANDNDEIERSEVFAAINDYLDGGAGAPTRADVFKLIELYLGD